MKVDRYNLGPSYWPRANSTALLIAYTWPSAPITVGVYASPTPLVRPMLCENVLVVRSQRYSEPSSLFAYTDLVAGSTTAELMHHSRKPPGGLGVTPRCVITSFITRTLEITGSGSVALGSKMAIRFMPSPVPMLM